MRKITRSLTALAVATTVAFAGTGVASAESSDLKLDKLFSSSKIGGFSSDSEGLSSKKLSKEEKQILAAAEEWAEEQGRTKSTEALKNAKAIHQPAINGDYEDFDQPEDEVVDNVFVSIDEERGTFFKVAKDDLKALLEFLEPGDAEFDDTYGLVVSSDDDHYYLTIGIAENDE